MKFTYTAAEINPARHHLGHDPHYYATRSIIIDMRGYLDIDGSSEFGFDVSIITASHASDWMLGGNPIMQCKKVTVGPKAWIGSNVTLFNCVVGEGSIVGLGSVVANVEVPPYTMVIGNPVSIVAVYRDGWRGISRYDYKYEETK